MNPENFFFYFLALALFGLYIAASLRRKKRARAAKNDLELSELVESPDELARAEQKAKEMDLRNRLLVDHVPMMKFDTYSGYSKEYVEQVLGFLRSREIQAESFFHETVPVGSYMAVFDRVGWYELFIKKGQEADAEKAMLDYGDRKQ